MVRGIVRNLRAFKAEETDLPQLHTLIESLQADIAELDQAIHDTWFAVDAQV